MKEESKKMIVIYSGFIIAAILIIILIISFRYIGIGNRNEIEDIGIKSCEDMGMNFDLVLIYLDTSFSSHILCNDGYDNLKVIVIDHGTKYICWRC